MSKTILPNHSATAKSCKQCVVLPLYLLKKIMTDLKKNKKNKQTMEQWVLLDYKDEPVFKS